MTIDLETFEVIQTAPEAEAKPAEFAGLVVAEGGSLVPDAPPYTHASELEHSEERKEPEPPRVRSAPSYGSGSLLAYGKLRTEQLRYLNRQRCIGLRNLRRDRKEALRRGSDPEELPTPPAVRGKSIRVSDLRYCFEEPTDCKWCGDVLTLETLALTFDLPIDQGGDPNIENVAAICKRCFFLKGFYPQWFWAKLIAWLKEENCVEVFAQNTATWARKAAYERRGKKRR